MKISVLILIASLILHCGSEPSNSIEAITSPSKQDSVFQSLVTITQHTLSESLLMDSLAFLILPVQASCPSCRKKTIDSIMKYKAKLSANHFIIISANGGRKTINGYFREQAYELPDIKQLFLDSNNIAYKRELYENKPTIYYTYAKKAYKKVGAIPATVRADLQEFFSGRRISTN